MRDLQNWRERERESPHSRVVKAIRELGIRMSFYKQTGGCFEMRSKWFIYKKQVKKH